MMRILFDMRATYVWPRNPQTERKYHAALSRAARRSEITC